MSSPYNWRWRIARAKFLALHPLCRYCAKRGIVEPATVCDHIIKHEGDEVLFWDQANWQPLCKTCHDSAKQTLEKSGYLKGSDLEGMPLDPRHPWLRGTDE